MRTKAVIYARVSSSNDRQDTSRQIEDLKRYAELQNIEIVKIYEEHISGAKKIEERQVLTDCLEYCKKKSVNFAVITIRKKHRHLVMTGTVGKQQKMLPAKVTEKKLIPAEDVVTKRKRQFQQPDIAG